MMKINTSTELTHINSKLRHVLISSRIHFLIRQKVSSFDYIRDSQGGVQRVISSFFCVQSIQTHV